MAELGAVNPPVCGREENSETDRDSDSAPHPPDEAGATIMQEKNTRSNQGWGCTETVPLCTNAHEERQQSLHLESSSHTSLV